MTKTQHGSLIRPPRTEEIDLVFDFMQSCDIADYGEPDADNDDLQEQWQSADLERDAWIALDSPGSAVGYAFVSGAGERFDLDIYSHRQRTPDGLEIELLRLCEMRAAGQLSAESGAETAVLTGYMGSVNTRLREAFESRGFQLKTHHYRMQIDFTEPLATPEWPAEYEVRPFRPGEEHELYQLIYSVFDWPGRDPNPPPFAAWEKHLFRGGRYDPELFLILHQRGRMVGAALAYDESTRGWVRQLAIAKDLQGQGVGSRLLRHILGSFSQRGLPYAALGVESENELAVVFYERCGMRPTRDFLELRKLIG